MVYIECQMYDEVELLWNTRSLFMSILIRDGADVLLTDLCLDHSPKGVIKHYISFDYDHKVEIFEKY